MDTVNRVVDASYKAIWGEQDGDGNGNASSHGQATAGGSRQTAATTSANGLTGIESVDKVIDSGRKAIWGDNNAGTKQLSTSQDEEPVAGKMGLGTATDPYDAGNRDEQYGAPPVEAGGVSTTMPFTTEQRNVDKKGSGIYSNNSSGSASIPVTGAGATAGSATVAAPGQKATVGGLRPDPSQPKNATAGADQALKHTSTPFEDETQKLAKDLQDMNRNGNKNDTQKSYAAAAGAMGSNHSKDASVSSSGSSSSSSNARDEERQGQKKKTSKLEKVKNKLHIGSSPKASR